MATVTGFTAARMLAIENSAIVDGEVVGDNLILTRFDTSTIDAGSVRGPTGSPGITEAELIDVMNLTSPIGSIVDYIGTVAPTNWALMNGQTIVDGETLHPELWAILPASMKSGSNIIMPDTRGRVSVGLNASDTAFDTVGETGGSKTHTLTAAEIPAHVHQVSAHSHTGPAHVHSGPSHIHSFSDTSTATSVDHRHFGISGLSIPAAAAWLPTTFVEGAGGAAFKISGASGSGVTDWMSASSSATHTHAVSGNTGSSGTANTGSSGTGVTSTVPANNTTSIGSGGAHNNLQPYIVFVKIIKTG